MDLSDAVLLRRWHINELCFLYCEGFQALITQYELRVDWWWARQGSNLGPTGYEPAALPLSYGPGTQGFLGITSSMQLPKRKDAFV